MLGSQYAPVSGTVEAINEELNGSPSLLNKSPEGDGKWEVLPRRRIYDTIPVRMDEQTLWSIGWLCKIRVKDHSEVRILGFNLF